MKYVLILPDGAADHPCPALDGKTPLEAGRLPHFQTLAREGQVGSVLTVPPDKPPGSDVCTMSLLGFDPARYHTGRAPLEAPSRGIDLQPGQVAFRCNLIHVHDGRIIDHCAGHLTTEEGQALIEAVAEELASLGSLELPGGRKMDLSPVHLHPGVQYRNLMTVDHQDWLPAVTVPPHDVAGEPMAAHLPAGPGSDELRALIAAAEPILREHPVNRQRAARGERTANQIWPWGQGVRPSLPTFAEAFGLGGAMIAAVDLLRSLGLYLGLDLLDVPGMTGYLDTNYAGKGAAAVQALETHDFVAVHVEAPDEAGHQRNPEAKVQALEAIDRHVVGPLLDAARGRADVRICALPDHPTPCDVGTHTREPVPFVFWGAGVQADAATSFTEAAGAASSVQLAGGPELMPRFLDRPMRT